MKNFRFTIHTKLMMGFGAVVAIVIVLSVLTSFQVTALTKVQDEIMDVDVPTQTLALEIRGRVHAALSAHRGYIILGHESLKQERSSIWSQIDADVERLGDLAAEEQEGDLDQMVAELTDVLSRFRASQERIVQIAHTSENEPAMKMFVNEALPRGEAMQEHLESILTAEADLSATAERKRLVNLVGNAECHLLEVTAAITQYLADGTSEQRAMVQAELEACSNSVRELTQSADLFVPEQQQNFEAYRAERERFIAKAHEVLETRSGPGWNQAQYLCEGTVTPLAAQADAIIGEIVKEAKALTSAHGDELREQAAFVKLELLVSTVAAIFISLGIAWLLRRSICPPLIRAAEAAQRVAEGDLTVKIDDQNQDECGDLARNFNLMVDKVSDMIQRVAQAATEVNSASTEIAETSEQMANGMEEQSAQITSISAAVEQMSASVNEVARQSADAAINAEQSGEAATRGGNVVDETIREMTAIRSAVDASAVAVQELGKRGEQIGEIISTINDIADQTNLLALNAAIEAARAGEHGRGFAVVADEVRSLADRTTSATQEIAESINAIQTETLEAVKNMNAGSAQVKNGVSRAAEAGDALGQIVTNATKVSDMIQNIASATSEQSSASEDVARNLGSITSVTMTAQKGTGQAAAASLQLSQKAEEMMRLVGQFKTRKSNRVT